jgi:gamma-butyrobetaine dioxygenase
MAAPQLAIADEGRILELGLDHGKRLRFHALWLRDNAPDAGTRSPGNGQRLITILDIPERTRLAEALGADDGSISLRFEPEGKWVVFNVDWLLAHAYDGAPPAAGRGWTGAAIERWDGALQARLPCESWRDVATSRAALGRWLAAVRRFGVARMTDAPIEPGAITAVAERFGYVRETNYGRWFDVRAEVNPTNLAYTHLGLQAHTDNPYRDPVPTLQILSCLQNSVDGGDSVVIDGFKIAERLQAEDEQAFELLARHCARFEYAGSAGVRLRSKRPLIELGPDGELIAVRFNNRSAAAITDVPFDAMERYYAAYRRFAALVEDPSLAVTFKLRPGELFIVDNTRVLHARKAFAGSGQRWLQGCYADKDGLLSTLAAIEIEQGQGASK